MLTGHIVSAIGTSSQVAPITVPACIDSCRGVKKSGAYKVCRPERVAYCNAADGGWELVLRAADKQSTFTFNSKHWTTATTLGDQESPTPFEGGDAKYAGFNVAAATKIRGCMGKFDPSMRSGCSDQYTFPFSAKPLLKVFGETKQGVPNVAGGVTWSIEAKCTNDVKTAIPKARAWVYDVAGLDFCGWHAKKRVVPCYGAIGINLDDTASDYKSMVRFGAVINNEAHVASINDAVGFGAVDAGGHGCGAGHACWNDNQEDIEEMAGTIWIQ